MNDTTSPLVEEANAYYRELLRPVFEGRKFLVGGPVAVGLGGLARQLLALGADRPFLIAGNAGTGTVPAPDEAELRVLGIQGGDILTEHRNLHRALENLPTDVQRVRSGDDGRESFASLSRIADRVRVMPFLEGIPASIHGVVFPDTVAVFRPVEMVVLRPLTGDRLLYAGCATTFDPSPADRAAMRDFACRVGSALRETVGYRGPFGVDGILAEDGFRSTELNARPGAGLQPLSADLGGLPLTALSLAIVAGEPLQYRPELLERAVVESSDAHRTCGGWSVTPTEFTASDTLDVVRAGNEYREARTGEEPDATFQCGPGAVGGFLRFSVRPERVVPGPSAAPEVVRAFRFADRRLGTDFGELAAARDVRS